MPNQYTARAEARPSPNPSGLCMCGCGGLTTIAPQTSAALGVAKGQHYRYMRGHGSRIWQNTWTVATSGCWQWLGFIDSDGYGRANGVRESQQAHRAIYERFVSAIPCGMELDHLCHTADPDCSGGAVCQHRRCVNPAHLEPVTSQENTARRDAHRDRCKHGHVFGEANTYIWTARNGQRERRCRTCSRENMARYRAQKANAAQCPPP